MRVQIGRRFILVALLSLIWFGTPLLPSGCQRGPNNDTAQESTQDSRTAAELLAALAKTYRDARSYQDVGELRFLVDGAPEDESRALPFSVAFQRPNQIRIHALDAIVVSDGERLRAVAQSLPDQMLSRPCGAMLSMADFSSDEMLEQAMRGQLDVVMPQLTLLLDEDAVKSMTTEGTAARLLDAEHHGKLCHRVAVRSPLGKAVYWISSDTGLLRKVDFPLDAIKQKVPLAGLWAEFRNAAIDRDIDSVAFKVEVPSEARLVKHFILPGPVEPSPLLGKETEDFSFVDLSGKAVDRDSLRGKIVVMDMWATWCHWCLEGLPLVEQVYRKYQDNDDVVFLAVSRDDSTISDEKVRTTLANLKLSIPIVRDMREITEKIYQAQALPTSVVLGKDGTIQDYKVGFDPQVNKTLADKIEKLLAGDNLAQQERDAFNREKDAYEARLQEALADDERQPSSDTEVARQPGDAPK